MRKLYNLLNLLNIWWWRRRESNLSPSTAGAGLRGSDPHVTHHRLSFKTHPIETYLLIMPATEQLLLGSPMGTFEFLDK